MHHRFKSVTVLFVLGLCVAASLATAQTDNETCLMCHSDADLKTAGGQKVTVDPQHFGASVHAGLGCVDCHTQAGNYDDAPHYQRYTPVNCAECHEDAVKSHAENFHHRARVAGNSKAPTCASCHGVGGDPHRLHPLDSRTAEESCRTCHAAEAKIYDTGVHAEKVAGGRERAGCITCHQSHGPGLPPAAGAVNQLCEKCHAGAMAAVQRGGHMALGEQMTQALNCASCHDSHGTHKPHLSPRVAQACVTCHAKEHQAFAGSVHEKLLASGEMHCLSCHSTHKEAEEVANFDGGCGTCHAEVEEIYRSSVHRFGRLRGSEGAATCADCHRGHDVLASANEASPTHPKNIPGMCGTCHGKDAVITSDFVRLPITLPNYLNSVHGHGWENGKKTAVCTDCHGTHDLQTAQDPESHINRFKIAQTCGQCHTKVAEEYANSIHGKAVQVGIAESPTCTDCHDEHLVSAVHGADARTRPENIARKLCGTCHLNPDMVSKFGITAGVVESYLDSYHGWAIGREGSLVASCIDCHNTHEIRAPQDPLSSVNPDRVTVTCARCHTRANETFARSYTHASALGARGPHGWAKLIYIVLLAVVLGGMALHNLIIARFELIKHRVKRRREPYIQRWQRVERVQHLFLLTSFFGLAITGFALRAHNVWWVDLIGLGDEGLRANLHRALAVIMTGAAMFHLGWLIVTRRGRGAIAAMAPGLHDFAHFGRNMAFHLGFTAERPAFRRFDYTQKAEYWAVIWGTIVMALTGLVLWFPELATNWAPAWVVRVAEVVHFYEAILAVAAIFIWHFFYVIFMPAEYPVSTVWLDGRMPAHDWKEFHKGEFEAEGETAIQDPGPSTDPAGIAVFIPKALRKRDAGDGAPHK